MTFATAEYAAVILLLAFFSFVSYKKRSLDAAGIIAGIAVGIITYIIGGIRPFIILLAFFVTAELCTRYARMQLGSKSETRTAGNIFGNAGAAVLALIIGYPSNVTGFFGAISTALADTASSEIGMLSKKKPVLITSFKSVEPGTDGGITLLGLGAAVAGAAIIATLYILLYPQTNIIIFPIVVGAGFIGSLVDSLLGAVYERRGMMRNTHVNFIASACGFVIAAAAAAALGV